jgi:hypothetical protein
MVVSCHCGGKCEYPLIMKVIMTILWHYLEGVLSFDNVFGLVRGSYFLIESKVPFISSTVKDLL